MKHARSAVLRSGRTLANARDAGVLPCSSTYGVIATPRPIARPLTTQHAALRPSRPVRRSAKPEDDAALKKEDDRVSKVDTERGSEATPGLDEAGDLTADRAKPTTPAASSSSSSSTAQIDTSKQADHQVEGSSSSSSAPGPSSSSASAPPSSSSSSSAPPSDNSGGNNNDSSSSSSTSTDLTTDSPPELYPQVLAIPMARRPLFPGFYKAVQIRNPQVREAIHEMKRRGRAYVGVFLTKDDTSTADIITDASAVHPVGVFCQVTADFSSSSNDANKDKKDDVYTIVLYPHRRIRITDYIFPKGKAKELEPAAAAPAQPDPPRPAPTFQTGFLHDMDVSLVNVENVDVQPFSKDDQTIEALRAEIISVIKDMTQTSQIFRDQVANFSATSSAGQVFADPERIADFAGAMSGASQSLDLQAVLEAKTIEERLHRALEVLKKELLSLQLQAKLSRDVDSRIMKNQRQFFLREQLHSIRKELGYESDGKDKTIEKLVEKADSLAMPENVRKAFDEELSKYKNTDASGSEANVLRTYLEWLISIPWGVRSVENFDLKRATDILNEDHYGLQDVKDRIMEFIAVGKLKGVVNGKILCLVGPPGVGKTSVGKSIARALDRQYYRFAVGGLYDVSEIKGHRRTYVGAMPGRIVQAFKTVQVENPMILIDEIDKLNKGMHGDPGAALLEVLDPEQNKAFSDHYLDVPIDLSRVLFVCTANTTSTISRPLLDRMEVIEVSGYIADEKMAIAERHLVPELKEKNGLHKANVEITKDAVDRLIRMYCSESGVRKLKQLIDKVFRKAAFKILQSLPASISSSTERKSDSDEATNVSIDNAVPAEATTTTTEGHVDSSSAPTSPSTGERVDGAKKMATTRDPEPFPLPADVSLAISPDDLVGYLGPAPYRKDRMYTEHAPPGIAVGLGYRGDGSGSIMPIESTTMPGKGLQLTGKLGDVIKESTNIALSFVKSNAHALGLVDSPEKDVAHDLALHLHMPEGATPKDGPSAGVAFVAAFVSLLSKKSIADDLAMTGEVSLGGKVLPVGGLKEKLLAARREGITKVILPKMCEPDVVHDVPASVTEGLELIYATDVRDVLRVAFAAYPDMVAKIDALPLGPKASLGDAAPIKEPIEA